MKGRRSARRNIDGWTVFVSWLDSVEDIYHVRCHDFIVSGPRQRGNWMALARQLLEAGVGADLPVAIINDVGGRIASAKSLKQLAEKQP